MLLHRPLQLNLQLSRHFSSPAKLWSCCCNGNPEKWTGKKKRALPVASHSFCDKSIICRKACQPSHGPTLPLLIIWSVIVGLNSLSLAGWSVACSPRSTSHQEKPWPACVGQITCRKSSKNVCVSFLDECLVVTCCMPVSVLSVAVTAFNNRNPTTK